MQEVLAKTRDRHVPLEAQEYFELRLDDLGPAVGDRFIVREAHAIWSVAQSRIMWDNFRHDECQTFKEAQHLYETRRADLVRKGFVYSDLDF